MGRKTRLGILLFSFCIMGSTLHYALPVEPYPQLQTPVFRLLAIEQMFDSYRMQSAQILIQELLQYPNWNNVTGVSYIHLLSLYNYNEVPPDVKPFWRGTLSNEIVEHEIRNFLGTATAGEIVILYFCGHSRTSIIPRPLHAEFMGIGPHELRDWLNFTISEAYFTLILDTCYSGYWIDFFPESTVLSACGKEQAAWGGNIGIFTDGLLQSFVRSDDTNDDGWIAAEEVFPYAKNFTESIVTWDEQNPVSYYGAVKGDLPLVQRDVDRSFPTWDIAISSITVTPLYAEPGSSVAINLTVENQGSKYIDFNAKLYVNSSLVLTQQEILFPEERRNIILTWFLADIYGYYRLSSMVDICPGEIDRSDNVCQGPEIVVAFKGDLNLDRNVRVDDVLKAVEAFGSDPYHARWNFLADLTGDEKVRIDDILVIARNFGVS